MNRAFLKVKGEKRAKTFDFKGSEDLKEYLDDHEDEEIIFAAHLSNGLIARNNPNL